MGGRQRDPALGQCYSTKWFRSSAGRWTLLLPLKMWGGAYWAPLCLPACSLAHPLHAPATGCSWPAHRTPMRVANVSMPNCLSPSMSGRSLVMAITVANSVTNAVMNLRQQRGWRRAGVWSEQVQAGMGRQCGRRVQLHCHGRDAPQHSNACILWLPSTPAHQHAQPAGSPAPEQRNTHSQPPAPLT